jgi:hypothetical protein
LSIFIDKSPPLIFIFAVDQTNNIISKEEIYFTHS